MSSLRRWLKEDFFQGWLPLAILAVALPILLIPAFTAEDDSPPPSNSPGHVGRWEYDNEPPADEGDMYAPPELDCDPTGCY